MKSIQLAVIGFILLVGFLIWEIIFSTQRYGLPKFNLISQPKPGSCKLLEQNLCSKGRILNLNNSTYVAFDQLPDNTLLFSPIDGDRTTARLPSGTGLQGSLISISSPDRKLIYSFIGDVKWLDVSNIKTGGIVGSTLNTETKSFEKYKLLITVAKRNILTGKLEVDRDTLNNLFK